ncbi:hypothetical protein U9K52_09690 [Chryseobacterium sp. MHB01]|uniref:hypothetical protein n=1 Tax=Chryseobacterium sp. MHB01 TaxID=3109433 RepID=UPI002AFEA92A|nr:hypothetical protein [Chryseobacterium sp. MHB01]MEA1849183.1 hypothetical protein [Chryseobacterium sp. MHB01]
MSNKTINEIKQEIEVLKKSLKSKIDEFVKANPELELNIEIEKEPRFSIRSENEKVDYYNPKIEVILK